MYQHTLANIGCQLDSFVGAEPNMIEFSPLNRLSAKNRYELIERRSGGSAGVYICRRIELAFRAIRYYDSSGGAVSGDTLVFVASSYAYAISTSDGSLYGTPRSSTPTGKPLSVSLPGTDTAGH